MIYKACGRKGGGCPLVPSALSCHSGICWGGGIFLLPDDSATVVPCGGACPRRHLLSLPLWFPAGGLPSLPPAYPAFGLPFCPPSPKGKDRPPTPFPAGEGGEYYFISPGASPPAPLHLTACGTYSPCRCGALWGACPRRHWLSLPRGRGPSQTPKFLSPGPPSPWLPALLTSAASQPPRHPWAPLTPAEPTTSRVSPHRVPAWQVL